MRHFLCGVERVKRFVNVHLHCIVSNLKMISKMSTLPPGKVSADAHGFRYCHCRVSVIMRPSGSLLVLIWPSEQFEFETLHLGI